MKYPQKIDLSKYKNTKLDTNFEKGYNAGIDTTKNVNNNSKWEK